MSSAVNYLKNSSIQPALNGWSSTISASNSSGFSALPGGYIFWNGTNTGTGGEGVWWTSTATSLSQAWARGLASDRMSINRVENDGILTRNTGFSVRCLKNTLPQVNTTLVTNLTPSTALVTGEVVSEGDQNTTRGFCYSTTSNPTVSNDTTMNGNGLGVYSGTLQNLTPLTSYYVKAYATNSVGTSYGNELNFNYSLPLPQPCPGTSTVTDVDGNVYNTVQIGNQCWTQSNLKVSKYRNGDIIPTGLSNSAWENTTSGAYAIYNNDPTHESFYGKLYNWYTVIDSRSLCPTGWHVPSDAEWKKLVVYLDANADTNCLNCSRSNHAGGFMKSTGNEWGQPNVGAVNISGFTALPSGYYDSLSFSGNSGIFGYWWSNDISFNQLASMIQLGMYGSNFFNFLFTKNWGFSVRCLKNTLPQVNTTSVTNVTLSTALVTGDVISDGGDQNTSRGFCYSTTTNPTVSSDTTMNGTGLGVYSGTIQNLTPLTTYYVRAYATNSVGTSYGNEVSFTTSLSIGSNYAGGIVFYIDSTGQHGLVCAPSDHGNFQWGCYGTDIVGTSTAFGTGQANTNLILSGCSSRPIAASVCDDLVLNGYSDWYLPSRDELQLMHSNLHVQGIGGFSNNWYRSSSHWDSIYAWSVNFSNVNFNDPAFYSKNSFIQVRAVRAF